MIGILMVVNLLTSKPALACEACNRTFLGSILGEERFNSLISKEIRAAIFAQEGYGGISTSWVNDVLERNNLLLADLGTETLRPSGISEMPTTQSPATAAPSSIQPTGEFINILRRDQALPIPPTSYVPQNTKPDKFIRITLEEGAAYIGNGVLYEGFTIDKKIPGPTLIVEEGDIVSFKIVNNGNIVHGASIHAVNSQTSKYLGKIAAGDSATVIFQANMPGVYMYHCAPGGHAIPMHIIFGQYGMMVVKPKKKYELERILNKEPDIEIFLVQHEYYASGKDAVEGQGKPMYTAFNGKLFRYVEEPIVGKPGDYVRINFLNVGPNLVSTFHIVGIVWDFAYWQGHPDNKFIGGQTVTAGPSDSWVVEFRIPPDEGNYLMLSHAVGSTDRGAIGLLVCDKDGNGPKKILAEGITYSEEELEQFRAEATRIITPFGIGTSEVDEPVIFGSETEEVTVRIIGNSYHPKVIQVVPGTTIRWVNEDVFTYMDGEFSGIHNVLVKSGPEIFYSQLMAHAESFSHTVTKEGEYIYMCTPHPYMEAKVIVKGERRAASQRYVASAGPTDQKMIHYVILVLAAMALTISIYSMAKLSDRKMENREKTT